MSKEKDKDPLYYLKLFSSMQKIKKKLQDKSLTKEEKRKIWEEGIPIWNEINKHIEERKSKKLDKIKDLEKKLIVMEEILKSKDLSEDYRINLEKFYNLLKKDYELREENKIPMSEPLNEKELRSIEESLFKPFPKPIKVTKKRKYKKIKLKKIN